VKLYRNNIQINLTDKIKSAEENLRSNSLYTISSIDHTDYIAAYVAWLNVGGNIFVKNPYLPKEQSNQLDERIKQYSLNDNICFNTSGTTGTPKIVVHSKKQLDEAKRMSAISMAWDNEVKFLNYLPGFTSGFWNIVLPSFIDGSFEMHLGSINSLSEDFQLGCNQTILVPSLIDMIRVNKIPVDFTNYRKVGCGSSPVAKRHAEFVFNNNGKCFIQMYGTTEICAPVLKHETTSLESFPDYLKLESIGDNEFKLVDNILYIKGSSLCENINDFETVDGWFKTNDLFTVNNNLIKFDGRTNDIIKINGYQASLYHIEALSEINLNMGETLAVSRQLKATEFIELFYTNKDMSLSKEELKDFFKQHLSDYAVPLKYTYIETIPKNGAGKKTRSNVKTDIQ